MHFTAAVTAQRSLSYTFTALHIPHILYICSVTLLIHSVYIKKTKNNKKKTPPGNTELFHPLVTGKETFTQLINFPPK